MLNFGLYAVLGEHDRSEKERKYCYIALKRKNGLMLVRWGVH